MGQMTVQNGFVKIGNERGVALLLVVSVVSLLIGLTVQFSTDMRQELVSSVNMRSSARMNGVMLSGYNIAAAVLQKDREENGYDSLFDIWQELDNSSLDGFFPAGMLDIAITDLSGRIPLNALGEDMQEGVKVLLLSDNFGELEEEDADTIVAAIVDWVDTDDEGSDEFVETESGYYSSLTPSYSAKNAPFENVEELLLLRGIDTDLYYGTGDGFGLRDIFSADRSSDGKININTAPEAVLRVVIDSDDEDLLDELVEKMMAFREDEENSDALQNVSWYTQISGWPGDVGLKTGLVKTTSSYFQILSRAEINGMVKNMTSVVSRDNDGNLKLMSRKVE